MEEQDTLHADACYSTIITMMVTMMIMMITMMMRRMMRMSNGFTNRGKPYSPLSRATP